MPDYNIYIHSAIASSQANPTQPWQSAGPNISSKNDDDFSSRIIKGVSKASGVMMNPDGMISQGVSMLVKAVPWVAIALVVAKVVDKIHTVAFDYEALETGDYRHSVNWSNFKANLSWIFKPFSNTWNQFQAENKWRIENYRRSQEIALLGDSAINSFYNRGV